MKHMELQRRLNESGLSKEACYIISALYEQQAEVTKQLHEAMQLVEALANSVQGFVALNGAMEEKLRNVIETGKRMGINVESVIYDPSKGN